MRNCIVYLKDKFDPIYIRGYTGHKIRLRGYSEFYGLFRTFYIQDKVIEYFAIDNEKGKEDAKET